MKFLILAVALFGVCSALTDADWSRFQAQHGKQYRSFDEVKNRRAIWESNWNKINKHNEEYAKGLHTYTLGENQFADMTYEEFTAARLGLDEQTINQNKNLEQHEMSSTRAAAFVDLRESGIITDVRDQGQCGGCWAFAVVCACEALYTRQTNVQSPDFSEQQLVDCSKALLLGIIRRNNGCNGGQLLATYDDVKKDGLQSESSYPYTATNGTCKYNKNAVVWYATGGVAVSTEAAIADAVTNQNVVTVGIYVSNNFQLYKSGVYVGTTDENSASPNHAVSVVGYDLRNANDYFYIIKNSWSTKWGENGYIRLRYGGNHLSITSMASYPK